MGKFRQCINSDQDHGGDDAGATVHPCASCGSILKKDSPSIQIPPENSPFSGHDANHPIPPPPDSVPLPHLHRWNSDPIPISPSAPLPPPPPCRNNLERSFSDPTQAYTLFSPAHHQPCSKSSYPNQLTTTTECSDLNKIRKMKKQMREMLKMCHKVMNFSQEDERETKETKKNENGQDNNTEAVTVEREEGSMNVSFKCQCGKSYQILVIGDKCYYKI